MKTSSTSFARRDFLKTVGLGSAWITQSSLLFADETAATQPSAAQPGSASSVWPVLRRYDGTHLRRIALPLGGIGTGTVSLGGRGDLRDWEIMNRPSKGFVPSAQAAPFFALYFKNAQGEKVVRALEGPVDPVDYEGSHGSDVPNHGLPRFRRASFAAAYPLGQVLLTDPDIPIEARLEAFNPMTPGDSEASGLPVAVLRYALHNKSAEPVTVAVCANLPNFIGNDGWETERDWKGDRYPTGEKSNRNRFRRGDHAQGVFMDSAGVDPKASQWGSIALATAPDATAAYRTHWTERSWGGALLDFWDDFGADGIPAERPGDQAAPMASLSIKREVPPGKTVKVTFLIAWHFPNRYTWSPEGAPDAEENRIGNHYTTRFKDAWDVAEKVMPELGAHETRTVRFLRAFCDSELPMEIKEAALFNASTLRTQTCFRTPDGRFYGWEGCCNQKGCCFGSCTHVWNYEQTTAFLYGDLALRMREVEFAQATDREGLMSFRVSLPLDRARRFGKAAADGQMGCIMKMYRDWQLSGNDDELGKLWPQVKRALEFCWIRGGWDADRDGVMEGCQHNTMDVEYYGPNPQMQFWYLGALRAAERMAAHLKDDAFAQTCRRLFDRGSAWTDANLFNGEYYEHEIRLPRDQSEIAPSLLIGMGAKDPTRPDFQLGSGCLVDQLVGQFMAHVCGLGYLAKPENIRKTLRSILRYNGRSDLTAHFNNMRSFALGEEQALLMASFPKTRPTFPFPYFPEAMTGFEYAAAIGMLYEGQSEAGLDCIRDIRARYDGKKRSPFNEAECGHHYARAMAAWAAVLAWTGFRYSAVDRVMEWAPKPGGCFWSNGRAWGTCEVARTGAGYRIGLRVLSGSLALREFRLADVGARSFEPEQRLEEDRKVEFTVSAA